MVRCLCNVTFIAFLYTTLILVYVVAIGHINHLLRGITQATKGVDSTNDLHRYTLFAIDRVPLNSGKESGWRHFGSFYGSYKTRRASTVLLEYRSKV